MKKTKFEDKFNNINNWIDILNIWFEDGDVFDNPKFWESTFYEMTFADAWDWLDIEPALKAMYPDAFKRYPWIEVGTEHLRKCVMTDKALIKPKNKYYNQPTFRAWMNIKDIINYINDYVPPPPKEEPTVFETLFERA